MGNDAGLYDRDFAAWAEQQAARLRLAAGQGLNAQIDWESVAEEIEGLARRDERELRARITRIIEHVLKLQLTLAPEPSRGWVKTIVEQRIRIEALLEQSPSLRRKLPDLLPKADRDAVRLVRSALEDKLRQIRAPTAKAILHARTDALSVEQVLGDWLPDRPRDGDEHRPSS